MVSVRFPFPSPSFPPHNNNNNNGKLPFSFHSLSSVAAAMACTVAGIGLAISHNTTKQKQQQEQTQQNNPLFQNALDFLSSHHFPQPQQAPFWASLSLASESPPTTSVVEAKTGVSFPSVVKGSQALLGVGLRRKSIFGLKNIDVYAFGVYADEDDVKKNLEEKYGKCSASELKESKAFNEDLLATDMNLTVRLQIVYSKLSIRSVRGAFEESVGNRLQKFGGPNNVDLLQSFTSHFKDDIKIPKGSIIELSREHGHVLRTKIDGEEVGSIQSKLLCQSVFDLYIGENPFDEQAKTNVMVKVAHIFEKKDVPVG